ncbi:DUF58 domain-containing protein [Chloroflexales bacterium ZM16-3]|nr:DUF58 domain-containing protein [Chloroflexales bacterium ZM16-3]
MLPTPRLLLLLLLAAPLVAGAAIARPLIWLALFYLVVVAGVLISDLLLTPGPGQIEVERINDGKLSLGAENLVTVLISNASPRPLRFTMRDEYPDAFPCDAPFISGELSAYEVFSAQYHLRPLKRGDYAFGDVVLRYRGMLGTFVRQARYPTAAAVQVYPNVLELRKYDLLARKGLLYEQGLRPARVYGQGGEFARLREYSPDDEFRRVSWKATARRGKPIVAEVETERSQHVICLIDTGRLMAPPLGDIAKLDYVINTALLLGYVAALKGDHVGLLSFADEVGVFLSPQRGRAQFQRMIEALYNVQAEAVESDHAAALSYLQRKVRRRSLVVLFTDLVTPDAVRPLIAHMARLSRQHLIVCVTISDPNVSAAIGAPPRDARAAYTRAVAEQLRDERQAILDTLSRSGVIPVDVPADKLTISVVNTYLRLKAQGRL